MLHRQITHRCTLLFVVSTIFATLCFCVLGQAQAQSVYSPVILYYEFYSPSRLFQMHEDGSGKQELAQCTGMLCGDLSHEGVAGSRYFIRAEASSVAGQPSDLVVYSEDYNSRTVLISDKSFHPVGAFWSLDGNRINYLEYWCAQSDSDNQCLENRSGLVVADVVRDNTTNTPIALVNERRIAEVVSPDSLTSPSWAPDNQHLAYSLGRWSGTGTVYHAYLINVPLPGSANSPVTCEIGFSGSVSLNSYKLRFSPVSSTDSQNQQVFKLAFQRITDKRPYTRFDIFTSDVPANYDGSSTLAVQRITNSTNAKNLYDASFADWSPDGQWLVYSASNGNFYAPHDIYKIRSDGSIKAINLTNSKTSMIYYSTGWR